MRALAAINNNSLEKEKNSHSNDKLAPNPIRPRKLSDCVELGSHHELTDNNFGSEKKRDLK